MIIKLYLFYDDIHVFYWQNIIIGFHENHGLKYNTILYRSRCLNVPDKVQKICLYRLDYLHRFIGLVKTHIT